MIIQRKRYVVMRNNRTEIWCGTARAYKFKNINDIEKTNIVSYHSEKKALASCSSWDKNYEVVPIVETLQTEETEIKCKKCGEKIDKVLINMFDYNGGDSFEKHDFCVDDDSVFIETNKNWTGYDLTDEEMKDTILCPHCKQYPFDKHIETEDIVLITCENNI